MIKLLACLPLLAALAGCATPAPAGYALSPNQVYARLKDSDLAALIKQRRCGVPLGVRVEGTPGKSVRWHITSGGEEYLLLTAQLRPTPEGRTLISYTAWDTVYGRQAYEPGKFYPRPVVSAPILPALEAQVAALIEGKELAPLGNPDKVCGVQRGGADNNVTKFQADDYYFDKTADRWVKRPGRDAP